MCTYIRIYVRDTCVHTLEVIERYIHACIRVYVRDTCIQLSFNNDAGKNVISSVTPI